mgnify:CR=1 FL=1
MPLVQSGPSGARRFTFVNAPGHPVIQRKNRALGTHAPDGRRYEVCPMCSARASLREQKRDDTGHVYDTWWKCMNCGYEDSDKLGPLN